MNPFKKEEKPQETVLPNSNQEGQIAPVTDEVAKAIETVNRANETSVLMEVICEKLGMKPQETTHTRFVEAFTGLQKASLEAQKLLQERFMTTPIPEKRRKKRIPNV